MIVEYVSVWDGGYEVRSYCDYDPETTIVSNIEQVDVEEKLTNYLEI